MINDFVSGEIPTFYTTASYIFRRLKLLTEAVASVPS